MSNQNILHLNVTKQWFDLMVTGIKTVEFREIKEYWFKRLVNIDVPDLLSPEAFKKFDAVHIKNGYKKDAPLMVVEHLKTDLTPPKLIKYTSPIFGRVNLHLKGSCYQIHLGEILRVENVDYLHFCTSCNVGCEIDQMKEDDDSNYFCSKCWEVLKYNFN